MELSAATAALQRRMGLQSPPGDCRPGISGTSPPRRPESLSPLPMSLHRMQQHQQQLKHQLQHLHSLNGMPPMKLDQAPGGMGYRGSPGCSAGSPPPVSSNPENNTCRLIDYRGVKVAAFNVDGRELICLPQAFELFLKHLVGGLHTVYTKLKRLDVTPVVCNVEQVRVLRGLGAIQPGVNRCKLISPKEFDILYDDCTNSSARPGRPPKRSALSTTPDTLEKLKKTHRLPMSPGDYYSSSSYLTDPKKSLSFAGNGYMHFPPPSEMQKSAATVVAANPLMSAGFPYPPHLANLFMPLSHPSMMNLAMANHFSSMRAEQMGALAAAAAAARDAAIPGPSGGLIQGPPGLRDLGLHRESSSGAATSGSASRSRDGDRSDSHVTSEHNNNNGLGKLFAPPSLMTSKLMDRPLNLETHKRGSVEEEPRIRSASSDIESAASSSANEGSRFNIGQLLFNQQLEKLGRQQLKQENLSQHQGRGRNDYTDDEDEDEKDLKMHSTDSETDDENHISNYDDDDDDDYHMKGYSGTNDEDMDGQKENKSTNQSISHNMENHLSGNQMRKVGCRKLEDICNGRGTFQNIGHAMEAETDGETEKSVPPPILYPSTGDVTSLETLLVHILGLVKLAADKSQAFCYEAADLKMKAAQERRLREELETRLHSVQRVKATLLKKLRRERKSRRKLEGATCSPQSGRDSFTPQLKGREGSVSEKFDSKGVRLGEEAERQGKRLISSPSRNFRKSPLHHYQHQKQLDDNRLSDSPSRSDHDELEEGKNHQYNRQEGNKEDVSEECVKRNSAESDQNSRQDQEIRVQTRSTPPKSISPLQLVD